MDGWIFLYKKFIDWEWYNDINTKSVFIHCLLKANYTDKTWRGIEIKRGQFFTSIKNLEKELKLTTKQIRTSLGKLKKTGEIVTNGASDGTMITVRNYESYQDYKYLKGKQGANKGQTRGKQRATTNKEEEKERRKKEEERVNLFWEKYHKITNKNKTDKNTASKNFKTLTKDEQIKAYNNIQAYYDSVSEKKYVKKAYTYLRDKNFNDEFGNKEEVLTIDFTNGR